MSLGKAESASGLNVLEWMVSQSYSLFLRDAVPAPSQVRLLQFRTHVNLTARDHDIHASTIKHGSVTRRADTTLLRNNIGAVTASSAVEVEFATSGIKLETMEGRIWVRGLDSKRTVVDRLCGELVVGAARM